MQLHTDGAFCVQGLVLCVSWWLPMDDIVYIMGIQTIANAVVANTTLRIPSLFVLLLCASVFPHCNVKR